MVTKRELIEMLENSNIPDDMEVMFAEPTHNHWRHTLARDITDVQLNKVSWSGYNDDYQVVSDDTPDDQVAKEVLLIS